MNLKYLSKDPHRTHPFQRTAAIQKNSWKTEAVTSQTKNINSKNETTLKSLTFSSTQTKIRNSENSRLVSCGVTQKFLVANNSCFQALSTNTLYFISACLAITEVYWDVGLKVLFYLFQKKKAFENRWEGENFCANIKQNYVHLLCGIQICTTWILPPPGF